VFFAWTPYAWLNMLLNLMIGFGQGGTEVVVNYSVVKIEQSGKSRLMNFMHAAFSVGAVIGPYIVILLMKINQDWQTIYRLMALVSIILAGVFLAIPFSHIPKKDKSVESKVKVSKLVKDPVLLLAFLILFVYVGSELGVSNWVSEFYVKFFEKSAETGALMVSLFWVGLLIGRLGTSILYKGSKPALVALGLSITCTVALLFALLTKHHLISGVGFVFAGLGYSAIYPLIMALVGRYFSEGQGAAVGFAATGGGFGSFVFPFIMASISQVFGIYKGFFFYFILNIIMTGLIIVIINVSRKIIEQKSITSEN